MQTLVKRALIAVCLFIFTSPGLAHNIKEPKKETLILSVESKLKYSTQISRVVEKNGDLMCVSEIRPFYPISQKSEKKRLLSLAKEFLKNTRTPAQVEGCRELVLVAVPGQKPGGQCADSPSSHNLLERIARDCGR